MTERLPDTLAARMMQESSSRDVGDVCYHCQTGNRFWLESLSDQNLSLAFSVDGISSSIVPPGRETPTLLFNTREGTRGKLDMAVNGASLTLLGNVDNSLIEQPEDLACGLIVGPNAESSSSPRHARVYIPFISEEVDLDQFLPIGMEEQLTEIDMVPVWLSPPGVSPLAVGIHHIDDLDDEALNWLWETLYLNSSSQEIENLARGFNAEGSLSNNSIATASGEMASAGRYLADVGRQYRRGEVVQAFKELMLGGRFQVRRIASWGGRYAVVFKGNVRSRSFLTAIMYGVDNARVSYISSYAQVASDILEGNSNSALRSASQGAAPSLTRAAPYVNGNFIGFFISSAFDVKEFMEEEDPEKNWGDLLGALGVTFIKVWAAGFVGIMLAGVMAATLLAGAPILVIVGLGAAVAIGVGVGLDWLDNRVGAKEWVKEKARSIANQISVSASSAFSATVDFVDTVRVEARQRARVWVGDVRSRLRRSGEAIGGLIFCGQDEHAVASRADGYRRWCLIGE